MIKKFGSKIISLYSILIFFMSLFFISYFSNIVKDIYTNTIRYNLSDKSRLVNFSLERITTKYVYNKDDQVLYNIRHKVESISRIIDLRITVVDSTGLVIADSSANPDKMDNHFYRVEIKNAFRKGHGTAIRYSNTLKTDMMYYAVGNKDMVVRLAKPLKEIDEVIAAVRKTVTKVCLFIFFIAVIINIIISRLITKPVKESIAFADNFSRGDFSVRIKNYGNDEVGHLQYTLNKLADTLEDKISSLRFEQDKLKAIIENIQDGILVISKERKVLLSNSYFNNKFYYGRNPRERFYYEVVRGDIVNTLIEKVISSKESSEFIEFKSSDGFYYEVYIKQITGKKNLKGVLIVFHDITDRKKAEQLKTDLVGNLSHELKTPISILKGYLETISDNLDDKKMCSSFIPKALKNVDRQNAIINDMLKLNKLETIEYDLDEFIDIPDMINNCLEILKPKYESRKLKVEFHNLCKSLIAKGNRFLAEEVFFNLIDNGISYNKDNGSLTIKCEDKIDHVDISIIDSGIGISPDSIDRIFERFYRADKGRSRNTGGTGLGLAIVKHAADILTWNISVESTEKGSTFRVGILTNK